MFRKRRHDENFRPRRQCSLTLFPLSLGTPGLVLFLHIMLGAALGFLGLFAAAKKPKKPPAGVKKSLKKVKKPAAAKSPKKPKAAPAKET
ncbi:hypothetical protein NDU88_007357 [Pleurodeles waltl]|uniref:Uncharacterized protein n=1 Tax=Pleurodeles waltl TaxID=8319 RepID=A0AAV7PLE5_PLEWA|nr:hypothetical protein NDU88_007357 [Pleurodeles waltl]